MVSHYFVDRLNYYFGDSIAYIMPAIPSNVNRTWYDETAFHPNYNTPKLTLLQYTIDDNLIIIYPETVEGNPLNRQYIVRCCLLYTSDAADE